MTKPSEVIKELITAHDQACSLASKMVSLFNNILSGMCEYKNKEKQSVREVFMNYKCAHPGGDGHCCIATCPLEFQQ